jgi:hypothetical protein
MANDKGGCSIMTDAQDRGPAVSAYAPDITGEQVSAWAAVLLANLRQPYPTKIAHEMSRDDDLAPPRVMTPVFCGCFDWHSAVHSHWALVRLRARADAALRGRIDAALEASITEAGCAAEAAYLAPRPGFELPYGIAWLIALVAELGRSGDADAARWAGRLSGVDALARTRFAAWLRRLPAPIRSGEHTQSGFAMSLVVDAARAREDAALAAAVVEAAERWHAADRGAPLGFEPSAYDFLSPALGVASLMARVRTPDDFAAWLDRFCPDLGRRETLAPVAPADRADGKLVHWDGLNLSRAWMLAAIAAALPAGDDRRPALAALARVHGDAGVAALEGATYAGSHWLPSFAIYWLTGPLA